MRKLPCTYALQRRSFKYAKIYLLDISLFLMILFERSFFCRLRMLPWFLFSKCCFWCSLSLKADTELCCTSVYREIYPSRFTSLYFTMAFGFKILPTFLPDWFLDALKDHFQMLNVFLEADNVSSKWSILSTSSMDFWDIWAALC